MPRKSAVSNVIAIEGRATRIEPPANLGDMERRLFLDIVTACAPSHFQQCDALLLARYCESMILAEESAARLAADGPVAADGRPSAWLVIREKSMREVIALSMRLKLSPQARRTSVTRQPPLSAYERHPSWGEDDEG